MTNETNETNKPADEMKDVSAGNIPNLTSDSSGPSQPGNLPGDPSINPPGASISTTDLSGTAAGNIPNLTSDSGQSQPGNQPGDPSINPPGASISTTDLSGTAAGVNATPDMGDVGGDPISDPPSNPNPGRRDSSSSPG